MTFLQLVINGVALGAAYALVALGFVFIVNATSAVNFAHGDLVMAGGYVAVGLGALAPLPILVLLPVVAAIMFAIGIGVALVAYFPLANRPPSTVFISTLLCGIVLQNLFLVLFGPQTRAAPPLIKSGIVHLGGIEISIQALGTLAVAAALIALQYVIFARTPIGRRLRATAQDRQMAQAIGIRASAVIAATFGFGTALAGVAGALLANQFFVYPTGGIPLSVYAYMAVVIGGWGSIAGAVIGAMMISLFQVVVSAYVSYAVATGLLYVALLLIFFSARRASSASLFSAGSEPGRRPRTWRLGSLQIRLPLILGAAALIGYAVFFASPYDLRVLTLCGIYALLVLGFQFVFGHAGAVSLAQATFFGIGGYVTGILATRFDFPFLITFPLSIAGPSLLAVIIACRYSSWKSTTSRSPRSASVSSCCCWRSNGATLPVAPTGCPAFPRSNTGRHNCRSPRGPVVRVGHRLSSAACSHYKRRADFTGGPTISCGKTERPPRRWA